MVCLGPDPLAQAPSPAKTATETELYYPEPRAPTLTPDPVSPACGRTGRREMNSSRSFSNLPAKAGG